MMRVNLHIHTINSDGGKTPEQIVELARDNGVEYFAITDHDQVVGNIEAARCAAICGIRHISGIELSCYFDGEIGFDESFVCHIVGLGIDVERMQAELEDIELQKHNRLLTLVNLLNEDGYQIQLKAMTINGKIPSRKTIARQLIIKGYASNSDECYEQILNLDRYRKYAKAKSDIREGIEIIHQCGGKAIWAHPFAITRGGKKELSIEQVRQLLVHMIEYKIDGIEVFYQQYTTEQINQLSLMASNNNLLKSIGTDYHAVDPLNEKNPKYMFKVIREQIYFDKDEVELDTTILDKI